MVLDSSAILALFTNEPGHERLYALMKDRGPYLVSAPNLFESLMVINSRFGETGANQMLKFLNELGVEAVPFTPEHVSDAVEAFRRYGKGHHPARLNFGDCMAYAVAKRSGYPLLYVGNDFDATDIKRA